MKSLTFSLTVDLETDEFRLIRLLLIITVTIELLREKIERNLF